MSEVASGEFGSVKLARHRLDGADYAVKVNKSKLRAGSYVEKKALNEVFAHATLNSNKHVVRYYNSWVEDGQVFIQNFVREEVWLRRLTREEFLGKDSLRMS